MNRLNNVLEFWGVWLFHSGWQAAVVVGVAVVLGWLIRRRSAQFRYALLLIALVKFATPPFLSLPMGVFSRTPSIAAVGFRVDVVPPSQGDRESAVFTSSPSGRRPSESNSRQMQANQLKTSETTSRADESSGTSNKDATFPWFIGGLFLIHLSGLCLAVGVFQRQYRQIRKLVRSASPASKELRLLAQETAGHLGIQNIPDVRISEESDAPFATGLFRQVILLPRSVLDLPLDQLRIILGHELVHIRRHDLAIGWIETVLGLLWWFHPGMWWLKRELRRTREDCCDDVLLASRLTKPERYCETLIAAAAARETFRMAEPVALGFSNQEHPAARRIRRLMDGSLFRTQRLKISALLLAVMIGLVVLPGIRPARAPVTPTSLEGMFGWRNLPFDPDQDELAILEECHRVVSQYRSTYHRDGRRMTRFDDPQIRDDLKALLLRRPDFFYSQYLLGTWYRRNGDLIQGQELLSAALKNAPIVLTQRYRLGNGDSLTNMTIDTLSIECNRVKNHSLNPELQLEFIDLVTDSQGEIAVPVYDTVFRIASRSYPAGFDTEMPRLGWFSSQSRIGVLPEVTAWKKYSRPNHFTRLASESAWLADAKGTTSDVVSSGPNKFQIGRVARSQKNGQFSERRTGDSRELTALAAATNAAYMDHAVIDLISPATNRFELGNVTVLDSRTKIPVTSFQSAAGVKVLNKTRFQLYALQEKLPEEVDLVLTVYNYQPGSFQMLIPAEAKGEYRQGGVTFVNEYLGAGEHEGWSSKEGFYQDAKKRDFLSEMLCRVEAPQGQRFSLWLVTKDGQRIALANYSPLVRIPRPLAEIDHFELTPTVPAETIYFEKIVLPPRIDPVDQNLPSVEFPLTGVAETVSNHLFAPLLIRCKTVPGDAYSDGSFSGEFGYGLYERESETHDQDSKSTVIIEAFGSSGLELADCHVALKQGAGGPAGVEVKSNGGVSMTGSWGTMVSRRLTMPLSELHSVSVRLSPSM